MKKKLQVFISSTFTDLQDERQAAVEAVLNSGHIPAGMELFKAGSDSQWDTITRWIDDSDVYCLILGGRYGSIEESSGKSYTHLEYDYALSKRMPVFAMVITDDALQTKISESGLDAMERSHPEKYNAFRKLVLSKICKFFDDLRDVKLIVLETLNEFSNREDLAGWVSGREVAKADLTEISSELLKLTKENEKLRKQLDSANRSAGNSSFINGYTYKDVKNALSKLIVKISLNQLDSSSNDDTKKQVSILDLFKTFEDTFTTGVDNSLQASEWSSFLFYNVAPKLKTFGLVEYVKVPSTVRWSKMATSADGQRFLSMLHMENIDKDSVE